MKAQAKKPGSAQREQVNYPQFLTVAQWPKYFDWPPAGGLRHIIFNAPTNGFRNAIKRVGGRVLIDADEFWRVVAEREGER